MAILVGSESRHINVRILVDGAQDASYFCDCTVSRYPKHSAMIMLINIWSHLISFLVGIDAVTVFLAPSIVGTVHVSNANSSQSHVDVLADWNSCGPVSLPFLVAVQTRGATSCE